MEKMYQRRKEFFICTITIFIVGFLIYGIIGMSAPHNYVNNNGFLQVVIIGLGGGYFLYSMLTGLLFTVYFISNKSIKVKIVLTIFFFIPIYIFMAGIFYSIPYGIYNFIQLKKLQAKNEIE